MENTNKTAHSWSPMAQSMLNICDRDPAFMDWLLGVLERNVGGIA